MQWLAQNWIWIALGIGALFFMTRMGGMGGCGIGHSGHRREEDGERNAPPAAGNRPGTLFDPVSGHAFTAGNAPFSSVYRGRGYYFESRENRDAFEANPEKYLTAAAGAGEPVASERDDEPRRRHRHGC